MRILIIMSGFFPGRNYGGPPVSVDNFCSLLKDECYIVAHNHDMGETMPYTTIHEGWNDRGNAKVMYVSNKEYRYSTFLKVARELHPDFIYLQGLFQGCIIPCLRVAQKEKIKVVLAPRGELCAGAFSKKYKKIPYIYLLKCAGLLKNVSFQSTSDEETEAIIEYLGASPEKVHLLSNIPSVPRHLPEREVKMEGSGSFVFISRIHPKKNLLNAIRYLKDVKGNVGFDVYGPMEDKDYWKDCERVIAELPSNITVKYQGVVGHDEIHSTFARYNAFLFPTLSENYGHVIAEALLSGCVPIISDQTPWTDMNEAESGWALPLSDERQFVAAIQDVVNMNDAEIKERRSHIKDYLENKLQLDALKRSYMSVFQK
jgi:glycosyltransferase involved in cell wall biosynthesis